MTDPIADMLTRIRNASAVKKQELVLPLSKIKLQIAKILEREGWIMKAEVLRGDKAVKSSAFDTLRLVLKYREDGKPQIGFIRRVSKPGLRLYVNKDELPRVLNNFGIAIISTSKGLLTDREARKQKIGGEVLCELY